MKPTRWISTALLLAGCASPIALAYAPVPDKLHGWCRPAGTKVDDKFSYLGKYNHAKGENEVHWFKVTRAFETVEAVRDALKSEHTNKEEAAAIRSGTLEHQGAAAQAGWLVVLIADGAGHEGPFTCGDGQIFVLAVPTAPEQQTR